MLSMHSLYTSVSSYDIKIRRFLSLAFNAQHKLQLHSYEKSSLSHKTKKIGRLFQVIIYLFSKFINEMYKSDGKIPDWVDVALK